MSHANARLTVYGRLELVRRVIEDGRPVAHVVKELNVSRPTGYKWLRRYREYGAAGLVDRSSRARHQPHRTPVEVEARILALRAERKLGPARIGPLVGLAPSTVHAVLTRHGMHRLAWLDRRPVSWSAATSVTGLASWSTSTSRSSVGFAPVAAGGSTAVTATRPEPLAVSSNSGHRVGYDFVHCAVDDHTRIAYAEIHPDEKAVTCAGFLLRAAEHFAALGIAAHRTGDDRQREGLPDRATPGTTRSTTLGAQARFTRNYRPQTNGKAERFNRTLSDEWAYVRPFADSDDRAAALPTGCTPTTITEATPHSAAAHQPRQQRLLVTTVRSRRVRRRADASAGPSSCMG